MQAWRVLRTAVIALVLAGMAAITPTSPQATAIRPWTPDAGVWYVAPGGNDDNDCVTQATPCATIDGAQGKSLFADGDTIRVATGTYTTTNTYGVLLSRDVTVSGGWNPGFTAQVGLSVIDGENTRQGLQVNWGVKAAVIERFVVRNAAAHGITASGPLTLTHSMVTDNRSTGNGAGIYTGSALTLIASLVTGNRAGESGGGISHGNGPLTLINSSVSGNTAATHGGGIAGAGPIALINSTVSENTAGGYGGAIFYSGAPESVVLLLSSSTIAGNMAQVSGGGIYMRRDVMTLQNTIIAGNTAAMAPDCYGAIGSAGYNLVGNTAGCGFTPATGDLTNVNPRLGRLVGAPDRPWYRLLLSGSPAIDAGNPAGCTGGGSLLTTDQRGAARVGRCDIGAYEYTTAGPAAGIYPVGGMPQRTPPSLPFPVPLRVAVLDGLGSPVSGIAVTFAAPQSGPSATFAGASTYSTSTDESGVATAHGQANAVSGSYAVVATASGLGPPASFALGNFGWYVAPGGDDIRSCAVPDQACATIGSVLGKAGFATGDTVFVASGTYTGTGNQALLLNRDVVLSGGWNQSFGAQPGVSVIDGENVRQVIQVEAGVRANVERFTVRNGGYGGIRNQGWLTLTRSTVISNTAGCCSAGGGISNGRTLVLDQAAVISNTTGLPGGGIWNSQMGTVMLKDSVVRDNLTTHAGGGIDSDGIVFSSRSAVSGNVASGEGGSIRSYGTLILVGSTVSGNRSGNYGGGIANHGDLALDNSTVSGNWAANGGGGLSSSGPYYTVSLNSSTVASNTAPAGGGVSNMSSSVMLQDTIIAGNSGGDCDGTLTSAGYNLIGSSAGCTFTPAVGDRVNVDPKLGPLEGMPGWHPLLAGSPAIDAGNPVGCTDHLDQPLWRDQRGFPRFGRCDIGAYEYGWMEVFRIYLPMVRK